MRFLKGLSEGALMALCCALPAHASSTCTDTAQNTWLTSCGWALDGVRRAEHPKDPSSESNTDVLFKAQSSLTREFVSSCCDLLAHPKRIPTKAAEPLSPLAFPPLHDPCTREEHLQWLTSCEQEALGLVGRTRADLLAKFREEGGLYIYDQRTFLHCRCTYLKVEVRFKLMAEQAESPNDVIEAVSFYIGSEVFD